MTPLVSPGGGTNYYSGQIFWIRCIAFVSGATFQVNEGQPRVIRGSHKMRAPVDKPWLRVDLQNASEWELGTSPDEQYPDADPVSPSAAIIGAAGVTGLAAQGTLQTLGDTVGAALPGNIWATARLTTVSFGTVGQTLEVSNDGGINWQLAPYAKRVDAVAANPQVFSFLGATPGAGSIYEIPLAGNTTNIRSRASSSGTPSIITLQGGALYTPGVPVSAILFDVTTAINTQVDTGILDGSGWTSALVLLPAPSTAFFTISDVDDTGASFSLVAQTIPGSGYVVTFGVGGGGAVIANNPTLYPTGMPVPKRLRVIVPAVAAATGRVRLEVRR